MKFVDPTIELQYESSRRRNIIFSMGLFLIAQIIQLVTGNLHVIFWDNKGPKDRMVVFTSVFIVVYTTLYCLVRKSRLLFNYFGTLGILYVCVMRLMLQMNLGVTPESGMTIATEVFVTTQFLFAYMYISTNWLNSVVALFILFTQLYRFGHIWGLSPLIVIDYIFVCTFSIIAAY